MKMISKNEAYGLMNEDDFRKYDELVKSFNNTVHAAHSFQEFYVNEDNEVMLQVFDNGEKIATEYFNSKKPVGRPSIGKTRRVSITLTEEQWNYIQDYIEPANVSLSKYFRELVEKDIQEIKEENRQFEEEEMKDYLEGVPGLIARENK